MEQSARVPGAESSIGSDEDKQKENKEQTDKALAWIASKWSEPRTCSVCRQTNWTIGGVLEMRPYMGGTLDLTANLFPVVPVVCTNCGYTFFFNAVISKLLPNATPAPSTDGKTQ